MLPRRVGGVATHIASVMLALLVLAQADSVPLAVPDCRRLAKAKAWTGVRSCSPPPLCPLEGSASRAGGPFRCSKSGRVTTLSVRFKNLKRRLLPGTIPAPWGNLASLRSLTLAGNPLMRGTVPAAFAHLKQLRYLDISNNPRLRGSIPKGLASSNNLVFVRLHGSGTQGKLSDFDRPNNEGNPLQLVISKDKPEVCKNFKASFPVLVATYYPSPATGKLVPTTPPDC